MDSPAGASWSLGSWGLDLGGKSWENIPVNVVISRLARVGFPAGFAAAAPFIGEFIAHVPMMAFGGGAYDWGTQIFDSANAGEVGKALGPVWLLLEIALLIVTARRWRMMLPLALAPMLVASLVFGVHLPFDFRWTWWGCGLGLGLAMARVQDPNASWMWVLFPAVMTAAFFHGWRALALPYLVWSPVALKPVFAGAIAGLVLRVGMAQGERWGQRTP